MTEGNVRDVMTSPDADSATKQLVAEYLISREPMVPTASTTTAVNSGSATGGESAPLATPTRTGIDHITSTVGEAAPKVVKPIANATRSSVRDVSGAVKSVSGDIKTASTEWSETINATVIIVVCGSLLLVLLICVTVFILKKEKR